MFRLFWAILLLAASCLGLCQALDIGWQSTIDPPEGTRDTREGKSIANGFQGVIHYASQVSNAGGSFLPYIEVRRLNNEGVELGNPVILSSPDWHYTNPRIFTTDPESNDVTVIYERVHPTSGERWLAFAMISANETILADSPVDIVKSVSAVRYRASERAIYALATAPYWQTFTFVRLYRFQNGAYTMPVSHTHQAEETGVDFTFDPNGDVYIISNSRSGNSSLFYGRIAKRLRTESGSWTFGWNRETLWSSTSSLTFGGIGYSPTTQRIVVGGAYYATTTDARPAVHFVKTDNSSPGWWWWSRPANVDVVNMNRLAIGPNGRVRLAGSGMPLGSSSRLRHYMDLDENTGFAYWWYSAFSSKAEANVLLTTSFGESIAGFAEPGQNGYDWFAAMPEPGVSFNDLRQVLTEPFNGTLIDMVETNDHDYVAVGTLSRSSAITRILLKPRPNADTFENLKEGRSFTSYRSVLSNDYRMTGAIAVLEGGGATSQGGSVTMGDDGIFTYQPAEGFVGTDTFTYKAVKTGQTRTLSSGSVTVSLIVVENSNPGAQDDVFTVIQGQNTVLNVLANDTDPEDDPLHVVSVGGAAHGTAWIEAGQVRYRSVATYSGTDSFTYTVSDDLGNTSTAIVWLNVKLKPVFLKSITPTSAPAGSADVTLTLIGANFVSGSKVFAGETELAKLLDSTTQLRATVPAAMMVIEASYPITVRNPNGAVSTPKTFRVIGTPQLRLYVLKVQRVEEGLAIDLEMRNIGTGTSKPQTVLASTLSDNATTTSLPLGLGPIPPGGKAPFRLIFPDLPSGALARLLVDIQNGALVKQYPKDVRIP